MTTLALFDFDGTLFRSPEKPEWWEGGWWGRKESLGPPCIPESPGSEWWVPSTVTAAHKAISAPGVHAVMLTGRPPPMRARVHELLKSVGLDFKATFFASGGTLPFKLKTIDTLITPEVTRVEVWEDRTEHLGAFSELLAAKKVEFKIHLVKAEPMPILCLPPQAKQADEKQAEVVVEAKPTGVMIHAAGGRLYAARHGSRLQVITSDLPESERGKGHGLAMYEALLKYAAENELEVTSDATVEAPAAYVWEALKRRGYPVKRDPAAELVEDPDATFWYVHGKPNAPVFQVGRQVKPKIGRIVFRYALSR